VAVRIFYQVSFDKQQKIKHGKAMFQFAQQIDVYFQILPVQDLREVLNNMGLGIGDVFHRYCMPNLSMGCRNPLIDWDKQENQSLGARLPIPDCLYNFPATPLSTFTEQIEKELFDSIGRNGTNLKLYKTIATMRGDHNTIRKRAVYRLESDDGTAQFDFGLTPNEGGFLCHVLILKRDPACQGNFFQLKRFLLGQVVKTLFGAEKLKIVAIQGRAMTNQFPLRTNLKNPGDWRTKKTQDGTTKLVNLYLRLGFQLKHPNSNIVILRKAENFTAI